MNTPLAALGALKFSSLLESALSFPRHRTSIKSLANICCKLYRMVINVVRVKTQIHKMYLLVSSNNLTSSNLGVVLINIIKLYDELNNSLRINHQHFKQI